MYVQSAITKRHPKVNILDYKKVTLQVMLIILVLAFLEKGFSLCQNKKKKGGGKILEYQ